MRSLALSLVREGHVVTTEAKGKTLRGLADRLVTIARGNDLQARRELQAFFGRRDVSSVLVDQIAPINSDRTSGFTTLSAVGNRAGDNALMVEVKWVTMPERVGSLKNPSPAPKNKRLAKKPAAAKKTAAKPAEVAKKPAVTATTKKSVTKKPTTKKPASKK